MEAAVSEEHINKPSAAFTDILDDQGFGRFQWMLLCFTGVIWAADSMEMMLLTFLMPELRREWGLSTLEVGLVGAVSFVGTFFGAFFWASTADKYGRRIVTMLTIFFCAIFGTLASFAPDFYWLLAFRLAVGFNIGGSIVSYTLFAEASPTNHRGNALLIEQGFWSFGALTSAGLAWVSLTYLNWRMYMLLSTIPLWGMCFFFPWLPESPRYLQAMGAHTRTQSLLNQMARTNQKPTTRLKRNYTIDIVNADFSTLCNLYYRFPTFLLVSLMVSCTFAYYGICFSSSRYLEPCADLGATDCDIKQGCGWDEDVDSCLQDDPNQLYISVFITTAAEVPGIFLGLLLLDKIGRKSFMSMCFSLYSAATFVLIFFYRESWIGLPLAFAARLFVSTGFYVVYIYYSEFYPTPIRASATGLGNSLSRIAAGIASLFSQDLDIRTSLYIYGACGIVCFLCTVSLPFDTTHKTLSNRIRTGFTQTSLVRETITDDEPMGIGGEKDFRTRAPPII